MSADESRRFTDREVALVLRRASEIDEARDSGSGRGLSLGELEQIADEVGISVEAIRQAAKSLDREREAPAGLVGAPRVRRAVYAVPGGLDQDKLASLIRMIDERTDGAGSVSEALGSVRWTSSTRHGDTQVSITPSGEETVIQVTEKTAPTVKRLFHILPAVWGTILTGPAVGAMALPGGVAALWAGVGLAAGAAIGRFAWNWRSANSQRRVERLAAELSSAAADIEKG